MRYAKAMCKFDKVGDKVHITGPYMDDRSRTRTVIVNETDFSNYNAGLVRYVQDAFPYLSADDREFLISGISPEGWEKMFGEE